MTGSQPREASAFLSLSIPFSSAPCPTPPQGSLKMERQSSVARALSSASWASEMTYKRNHRTRSGLEATALAAATSLLKLAALGAHEGLRMRARYAWCAEVLNRLARVLRAAQQHAVAASRRRQRQLVKGQNLAASLSTQPLTSVMSSKAWRTQLMSAVHHAQPSSLQTTRQQCSASASTSLVSTRPP